MQSSVFPFCCRLLHRGQLGDSFLIGIEAGGSISRSWTWLALFRLVWAVASAIIGAGAVTGTPGQRSLPPPGHMACHGPLPLLGSALIEVGESGVSR